MRVWIETFKFQADVFTCPVTLRVRVWIETEIEFEEIVSQSGHPPREGVD